LSLSSGKKIFLNFIRALDAGCYSFRYLLGCDTLFFLFDTYKLTEESVDPIYTSKLKAKEA